MGEAAPDPERREDAAAGAIAGTFAGDALGRPFEGAPPLAGRDPGDRLTWLDAERVLVHTDDTQLTLALAAHLLGHPDVEPEALVATILAMYEPHRGYGGGMRRLVAAWQDGVAPAAAATSVFPDGSFGNGAAMRAAPVALLHLDDPERRRAAARAQAMLTHVNPIGVDGALVQTEAVAVAAVRGRFGGEEVAVAADVARTPAMTEPLAAVPNWVRRWRDDSDVTFPVVAAALGAEVVAERSVPAALWCAAAGEDVEEAIGLALGLGGDADTIAAMAGAIRGAADGLHAIPHAWLVRLEDGAHGISWALDLARRLVSPRR